MSQEITPEVGMGVTKYVGSDRYPYTVVEVITPKKIVVQADNYVRTDKNGQSESQEYTYTPNTDAERITITKRKNGRWVRQKESSNSIGYGIGHRRAYQDPSY